MLDLLVLTFVVPALIGFVPPLLIKNWKWLVFYTVFFGVPLMAVYPYYMHSITQRGHDDSPGDIFAMGFVSVLSLSTATGIAMRSAAIFLNYFLRRIKS